MRKNYFLDIAGIKEKLKIEEQARRWGHNELPKNSDTDLDSPQKEIVHYMTQLLAQRRQDTTDLLNNHAQRRQEIRKTIDKGAFESIPSEAESDFKWILREHSEKLFDLREEEQKRSKNLKLFVETNKLYRDPDYPESSIFHWALVFAAIIAESIANSYFFAKGSDFGLVGGSLQALLISIANIGSSLLAGKFIFPHFHSIDVFKKRVANLASSVYIGLLIFFNLATGHYRELLETDPLSALKQAIPHLVSSPLGINNYDAWVLIIIGILFTSFGAYKGYTSDDPYPGFGRMDRKYNEAHNDYLAAKIKLLEETHIAIDKRKSELKNMVHKAVTEAREHASLVTASIEEIDDYDDYVDNLESGLNTLLSTYRDINSHMRTDTAPEYFKTNYTFGPEKELPDFNLETEKLLSADLESTCKIIEETRGEVLDKLHQTEDNIRDNIDKYIDDLEHI